MFVLPNDADSYVAQIRERVELLIATGIWRELHLLDFKHWWRNFDSEEDQYFGACVLDALIYRSAGQTIALMEHLFHRVLPDHFRLKPHAFFSAHYLLDELRASSSGSVLLIPVIRDFDPPTKSGPLICRMLRRHLQILQSNMKWPWLVPSNLGNDTCVIFVDDFLGTGDQFIQFMRRFGLEQYLSSHKFVYAPLVAHERGVRSLNQAFPSLSVVASEFLGEQYSLFSDTSNRFADGVNDPQGAYRHYLGLLDRKGIDRRYGKGYGDLSLTYVFEHATPDNNLALLWYRGVNWVPLFER